MAKRKRRALSAECKAEVAEPIRNSGRSVGAVARELDLTATAVLLLGGATR
jgi:transposase-like protein